MNTNVIGLLIIINFLISIFNAWSVGKVWFETKAVGGWPRILAWSGAVMSVCGFTWVYMVLLGSIAFSAGKLDQEHLTAMFSLGYVIIILPLLGSGVAITINSWIAAWKRRTFTNMGVAGWNTFAQAYNTYNAVSAIPEALKGVFKVFGNTKGGNKNDAMARLALLLVVIALLGGVLSTSIIIRIVAREHAMKTKEEFKKQGEVIKERPGLLYLKQ